MPSGSKVVSGGHKDRHMDRQTGDLISILLFLESRLIMLMATYVLRIL
jgi:hypothetical protein